MREQKNVHRQTTKINTIEIIDAAGRRMMQVNRGVIFLQSDDGRVLNVVNSFGAVRKGTWCVQAMAQANACFVVNLSPKGLTVGGGSIPKIINPQSGERVTYGHEVEIDNFKLTFHRKRISRFMELDLYFPPELTHIHTPDNPLEGKITLHNKGDEPRVQFQITEIGGIETGAYDIDSLQPTLVHTRERAIRFSIFHPPGNPIPSGYYNIAIYAKADKYPEEIADFQEIYVSPFYDHSLEFDAHE